MIRPSPFFLLIVLIFSHSILRSQSKDENGLTSQDALNHSRTRYFELMNDDARIYQGIQYVPFTDPIRNGHPYFNSSATDTGSITYGGLVYEHVPMLYDLVQKVVVVISPNGDALIQLHNDLINEFSIAGHLFLRMENDSLKTGLHGSGFYEMIYKGRSELLKMESKEIKNNLDNGEMVHEVLDQQVYFVRLKGHYYSIKSKHSFMSLLGDRKGQVKEFLTDNSMKFGENMGEVMAKALAYYDGLKP